LALTIIIPDDQVDAPSGAREDQADATGALAKLTLKLTTTWLAIRMRRCGSLQSVGIKSIPVQNRKGDLSLRNVSCPASDSLLRRAMFRMLQPIINAILVRRLLFDHFC